MHYGPVEVLKLFCEAAVPDSVIYSCQIAKYCI